MPSFGWLWSDLLTLRWSFGGGGEDDVGGEFLAKGPFGPEVGADMLDCVCNNNKFDQRNNVLCALFANL